MSLKVGMVNDSAYVRPCGYNIPPCRHAGPYVELTIYIIRQLILNKTMRQVSIEFVPLQSYGFEGSASIFGSLSINETDMTPPYMQLSYERLTRSPSNFLQPPPYSTRDIFVYRTVTARKPNLSLFTSNQWHVWVFMCLILFAWSVSRLLKFLFGIKIPLLESYLTR